MTGNYCFFNLLTIALCLLLIDDAALPCGQRLTTRAKTGATARTASRP